MKKKRKDNNFIKKPYYKGGISGIKAFINKNLTYPKAAKENKIEGMVYVRYSINYKGKVIATKIITGIGHGCNEEATRLVEMLEFIVPKNRNLKAVFHKDIQIHFRLPKIKQKDTPQPLLPTPSIQYNYTPSKKEQKSTVNKEKKGGSYEIIIQL